MSPNFGDIYLQPQFHFEIGEICTVQMGLTDSHSFVSGPKYKYQ